MEEITNWIKLSKNWLFNPIWQDCTPKQKVLIIILLLRANYQTNRWTYNETEFICHPGEFITSLDSLHEKCSLDISKGSIQNTLRKLVDYNFITETILAEGRLIKIINWNEFQTIDSGG